MKRINLLTERPLRSTLNDHCGSNTDLGGRPNNDPILMVKILFLQSTYNLVEVVLGKEMNNRIDFMNFLSYPYSVPDSGAICRFREQLYPEERTKTYERRCGNGFNPMELQ